MSTRPIDPSAQRSKPLTIPAVLDLKRSGTPIVMVTAYDYPGALAAERAGVDLVLVGDSGAMTVLGHRSTTEVTVDEMLVLTKAARRGVSTALLVADLPFGSYEVSDEHADRHRRPVRQGGRRRRGEARGRRAGIRSAARGPSSAPASRSWDTSGSRRRPPSRSAATGRRAVPRRPRWPIAQGAVDLQEAGCFCIVFEAVPAVLTDELMKLMDVPIIGIGAGPDTDGQVLVFHDLLGIREGAGAKFVRRYADLLDAMGEGIGQYADDVRSGAFPAPEHGYGMDQAELENFRARWNDIRRGGSDFAAW